MILETHIYQNQEKNNRIEKKKIWVFSTCSHPPGVGPITRDQDGNWKNPLIAPLGTSSGVIMPNFVFLPPVVLSGHIPGSKMRPSIF